ncbi:MAG: DUF1573 domain-containing protein [Desulfobacterales bacterium]|nr:DUF1573 domain-containing protein [Desulfobacterales bacterium]
MMKKLVILIVAAGFLTLSTGAAMAAPKAVPVNPAFEFSDIAEGQGITHEFIIRNEGDANLNILSVIPP